MLKQKATDYFSGRNCPKLNCAQSIVAVIDPNNKSFIDESAKYGGGEAPHGWCGPAYVSSILLNDKELVEREFSKVAGSVKCEKIKEIGLLLCSDCVELGVDLIEKNRK